MARCKQTNRTRARPAPKANSSNAAVDSAALTTTHDTTNDSPTDLADQINALSFGSRPSIPRSPTASNDKSSAGRVRKPKAPKFLPRYRVGKYTKRVEAGSLGVKKEGNSTRGKDGSMLLYCLDCVRPHLHVYCDGVRELKTTHLCSYHIKNPDPRHAIAHYPRIWKFLTNSFFEDGTTPSGAMTKPRFMHRTRCAHDKTKPLEQFFPADLVGEVKMVDEAAPADADSD